ncbi:hypothetical protein L492_2071 [Bordetella bronchiseptica 7E71]|nr:hypothetical protein L492_2071 [Bordetella bronchiseptica 7E71]
MPWTNNRRHLQRTDSIHPAAGGSFTVMLPSRPQFQAIIEVNNVTDF